MLNPMKIMVIFFKLHKSRATSVFTKVSKLWTLDFDISFSSCHDNHCGLRGGTGVSTMYLCKISMSISNGIDV